MHENNVPSIRITSLYGSQPSYVVFCLQNIVISTRIASLYGSQPSSVVFASKTASFGPELHVSMGPRPHLWFLHAKQRLLDLNYISLWVPGLICGFCMQNSVFWTRITCLYGSQASPVVLCMKNSVISTRILVPMGPSPRLWFCACISATLGPELHVSVGPRPHLSFCA